MKHDTVWKDHFLNQDPTRLAMAVRDSGSFAPGELIRALADDRVLLCGGATEAARLSKRVNAKPCDNPECVVVTPVAGQSVEDYQAALLKARKDFPTAELAGFGPDGWAPEAALLDRVVVKVGEVSSEFRQEPGWRERLATGQRATAVIVYTPSASPSALEQAAEAVSGSAGLVSVVALPVSAGDRIPLPGLTTAGTMDMMILSALRHLLPSGVRLRASWAALGWKVAQLALLYGANELAGWTAAETSVYTGRVRAAARVESDEVLRGIEEARCQFAPWSERIGAQR